MKSELEDVIKRLYKERKKVIKYVRQNNGTKADAEDLSQEALIVFCQKRVDPSFQLTTSDEGFYMGIVKNLWMNKLRKSSKEKVSPNDLLVDDLNEEKYVAAEIAYEKLSKACQELLSDFYVKMLSMKEIASENQWKSEKIAKDRKYKCLSKARKLFQLNQSEL